MYPVTDLFRTTCTKTLRNFPLDSQNIKLRHVVLQTLGGNFKHHHGSCHQSGWVVQEFESTTKLLTASELPTPSRLTSAYQNTSSSASEASPTPVTCCLLRPQAVAIGEWWDTTYSVTTATVITKFTQYNDTIITQTTLLTDSTPDTRNLSIPDLIFGVYGTSTLVYGTTASFGEGVVYVPLSYSCSLCI